MSPYRHSLVPRRPPKTPACRLAGAWLRGVCRRLSERRFRRWVLANPELALDESKTIFDFMRRLAILSQYKSEWLVQYNNSKSRRFERGEGR